MLAARHPPPPQPSPAVAQEPAQARLEAPEPGRFIPPEEAGRIALDEASRWLDAAAQPKLAHGTQALLESIRDYRKRTERAETQPPDGWPINPLGLADLIAGLATDTPYTASKATEGRLPREDDRSVVQLSIRGAIWAAVELIWRMSWTEALESEPGPSGPPRSTAGLLEQIRDLVERLDKRSPESWVKHGGYVGAAHGLPVILEEWISRAEEVAQARRDAL